jgi:hypothetical protein
MTDYEGQLIDIVVKDGWMMEILRTVRDLALPDCWIGAGFVRAKVWDFLHGHVRPTPLDDIDVLYFEPANTSKEADQAAQGRLRSLRPKEPWSVKNQARMHLRNGDEPYADTEDALRFWLETPTCVAVGLDAADRLSVIAPYGLADLFAMVIRPTPAGLRRSHDYNARVGGKPWCRHWPGLKLIRA